MSQIRQLVDQLADKQAVVREKSRKQLIQLGGHDVTQALVLALINPQTHVRWEAAKALQAIADPVAAPALLHALDDKDGDVRWVAAEGLIALDEVGVMTVLSGLLKRADSIEFCSSAHHVLHGMKAYADLLAPVLKALEQSEPELSAPLVAYDALVALSDTPDASGMTT